MGDESLFVAVVGGYHEKAHVELHDTRFVIGKTIENCYTDLIESWWGGSPSRFHLDAWGKLKWADGYRIDLVEEKQNHDERLWFVNLGGYNPAIFNELHKNVFVVARDERDARKRALKSIDEWKSPHKDAIFDAEITIDVAGTLTSKQHLRLTPDNMEVPFLFEARYVPIGKMAGKLI